jgi:hypothetical protein
MEKELHEQYEYARRRINKKDCISFCVFVLEVYCLLPTNF